ncbi:hypothetical protein [Sorangium sp. So ce233]|uniref:hypothetical protein n=1 Tax=Sorangium sp. So ce233 TaxID=3133290 RepID=UPI003F636C8F
MRNATPTALFLVILPLATGCGTTSGVTDAGAAPCDATSPCQSDAPPESVCLEHLAAGILDDGCGVFVAGWAGGGDDANPGTKAKPVFSVQRAVDLARTARGRVILCNDGFVANVRLPSGVDLLGGFNCRPWGSDHPIKVSTLQAKSDTGPIVTVEPASIDDTGAADGISTIADIFIRASGPIAVLVQSGTAVEILRNEISADIGGAGHDGEEWPGLSRAVDGAHGIYGGDACSAATVAGGPAVVNPCDGGIQSVGGKGGDGLPSGAEDGGDGEPVATPEPSNRGRGGDGDVTGINCEDGSYGADGTQGAVGAAGQGIGHISKTGWHGDNAGDGGRGMPGQGGGGGGGRRGGLAVCGVAAKGGAGGGSGAAGGCGGRGGRGAENGHPSIGIVALRAKVIVRDTVIETSAGGPGGDGGPPEQGGKGGRGAPGGALGDGTYSCGGGNGGRGGDGGYGGPGRGGDSIGIAYLDEDQLTLEGVTYELGPSGEGGTSWDWSGDMIMGEDGVAAETLHFAE